MDKIASTFTDHNNMFTIKANYCLQNNIYCHKDKMFNHCYKNSIYAGFPDMFYIKSATFKWRAIEGPNYIQKQLKYVYSFCAEKLNLSK